MSDEPKAALRGPITGREPDFLHDVPMDNVVGAITGLTAELYIVKERLAALERVLAGNGQIAADAVERFRPDAETAAADREALEGLVRRIFGELARDRRPTSSVDPAVVDRYLKPGG